MKKTITFITAMAMMLTAVSCAEKSTPEEVISSEVTAEKISFKEADIKLGDDFETIVSLDKAEDSILIFGTDSSGRYMGYVTDSSFDDHTKFTFEPQENETVKSACLGKFGKTVVLTLCGDELIMYVFNKDGELFKDYNLGEHEFDKEMGAIIAANGDDYVINLNNESLLSIKGDGTVLGEVNCSGTIMAFSKDSNNLSTVVLNLGDKTETAHIDGTSLTDEQECSDILSSAFAICGGNDTYTLVGNFMDGLYGLKGDTWVRLTDYMDNTFAYHQMHGLLTIGENEFAAAIDNDMKLLSERDISEIKAKKTITVASFREQSICDDLIKRFNAENEEYRVEVVPYLPGEGDNIDFDKPVNDLKLDIVSGKSPDIIMNFIPGLDPSVYYCDLKEFLEKDPDLNADDFIPGLLDSISFKGTIPMIFPTFSVETIAAKTKFVGEKEGVSYDEFIKICSSVPDEIKLFDNQDTIRMEGIFLDLVNLEDFVDYEKAECHFDSPDFVKMLEFVKDNHIGMTQDEWNILLNGENGYAYDEDVLGIREDRLVFFDRFISPSMSVETLHAHFNEPATLLGYPCNEGNGGYIYAPEYRFSILRSSKEKEGAWEFIKTAFDEKSYETNYRFPVLEDEFEKSIASTKTVIHYEEGSDEELPGGRYNYECDENGNWKYIDYEGFTDKEAADFEAYVRECVKTFRWSDEGRDNIINEELVDYFNSDRTAENAAEIIQNRVSIYLSENYG